VELYISYLKSPIGILRITADNVAIKNVFVASEICDEKENTLTKEVKRQLNRYFSGKSKEFDFPINPDGTDFQKRVWRELVSIPYGKTVSYGRIACALGCPKGARAVGNAVGKNRVLIIIPCHRVIYGDGRIGGFSGDIKNKIALLRHESEAIIRSSKTWHIRSDI